MKTYRLKPHECQAVQWKPGVEAPGIYALADDQCYSRGLPSGSAAIVIRGTPRVLREGEWIVYGAKEGPTIWWDGDFQLMFDPVE